MMHWQIYGHDWALNQLDNALRKGRLRHAHLFYGPKHVGKETVAWALARAITCQHYAQNGELCPTNSPDICPSCRRILNRNFPDILKIEPLDGGQLKIEEVRNAMNWLALKPFESKHRIVIFRDFDHAQPRVQDALLKTLEEPPAHGILILLVSTLEAILPTITSRSQVVHLRPSAFKDVYQALSDHGVDENHAGLLAHLSGGRVGWALNVLQDDEVLKERETALTLLEGLITANRITRFQQAETLSKDKGQLGAMLALWLTYWRDLLHLREESGLEISNVDHLETIRNIARMVDTTQILKAIHATRDFIHVSNTTNANLRLQLEAMLLQYPLVNG